MSLKPDITLIVTDQQATMAQRSPAGDNKLMCGFEPRFEPRFLEPLGGAWGNAILFGRGGVNLRMNCARRRKT